MEGPLFLQTRDPVGPQHNNSTIHCSNTVIRGQQNRTALNIHCLLQNAWISNIHRAFPIVAAWAWNALLHDIENALLRLVILYHMALSNLFRQR